MVPGSTTTLTGPWQRRPGLVLDVTGLSLLWLVELLITWKRTQDTGWQDATVVVLSVLLYLPLFLRRRWPLSVLLFVVAGSTLPSVLVAGFHPVFCVWVALFAAAVHNPRRTSVLGLLAAFLPVGPNVAETLRDTPDPSRRAAAVALVLMWRAAGPPVTLLNGRRMAPFARADRRRSPGRVQA